MKREDALRNAIGAVSLKLADTRRLILDVIYDLVRLYRLTSSLFAADASLQDDLKERINELLKIAEELEKNP